MTLDDLALKPKPNSIKKLIMFRILALLSFLFCLLVIITEATVIVDPEKTLVYFVNIKNINKYIDCCKESLTDSHGSFVHYIFLIRYYTSVFLYNLQSETLRHIVTCSQSYRLHDIFFNNGNVLQDYSNIYT